MGRPPTLLLTSTCWLQRQQVRTQFVSPYHIYIPLFVYRFSDTNIYIQHRKLLIIFFIFFLSFFTKLQYRSYRTIINIISSRAHRKEKEVSISIRHFLFFFANNKFDTIFLCRCSLLGGGTFKLLLWICLFSLYFLRHWVRECFRIQVFCKLLMTVPKWKRVFSA